MKQYIGKFSSLIFLVTSAATGNATLVDFPAPVGSERFGELVKALPNGNVVVVDPMYDTPGGITNAGAVHLFSPSGVLISSLTGNSPEDQIGSGGIIVLPDGNFLVLSPNWDSADTADVGALTFLNSTSGLNAPVISINSMIGSHTGDFADLDATLSPETFYHPLSNGHYVISLHRWDYGGVVDAGAVVRIHRDFPFIGEISEINALIGTSPGDMIGFRGAGSPPIHELPNGSFIISSPYWDVGNIVDAGASTWVNSNTPLTGFITLLNSLVGSHSGDKVGSSSPVLLANGHYVLRTPNWQNNAGAVTWVNGDTGITSIILESNSIVGSTSGDTVGIDVLPLENGNYVINSYNWNNGAQTDAGAITWMDGNVPTSGVVSTGNSFAGAQAGDAVGSGSILQLTNGNYVVLSPSWHNSGAQNAGAATWVHIDNPIIGTPSAQNSIVGSSVDEMVGIEGIALSNGHYVVRGQYSIPNGPNSVGAITWGNGETGTTGEVSAKNSLTGSQENDNIGDTLTANSNPSGLVALENGNYAVASPLWDSESAVDVGAITWMDGSMPAAGVVTPLNSVTGNAPDDFVGAGGLVPLAGGNYLSISWLWDSANHTNAGAVTFHDGLGVLAGPINETNSLIGSYENATLGCENGASCDSVNGVQLLANGNYVVYRRPQSGTPPGEPFHPGSLSWGSGLQGVTGAVNSENSVIGDAENSYLCCGVLGYVDGNYVALSSNHVRLGHIDQAITGVISNENSLLVSTAEDPLYRVSYSPENQGLVYGVPSENVARLFFHNTIFHSGFEQ